MEQTIRSSFTVTLKRPNLAHANLGTFSFYLLGTFLEIIKKYVHHGVAAVLFSNETSRKIEQMNFPFRLKTKEIWEYNIPGIILGQKKVFRHKK